MRINQRFNRDISKIWQSGQVVKVGLCLLFMISAPFCLSDVFSATGAEAPTVLAYAPEQAVQKKMLTGKVVDTNGEPIIGANIIEKGVYANGVITDLEGTFKLRVKQDAVIEVSYIGYVKKEVFTKGRDFVTVTLQEDAKTLEEVVVVGYGSQKKISVTGSVASIQTEDLLKSSQANLAAALSGRLPGLATMQTSGRPGGDDVTLYLRGASTTNGVNPLILIDGVPRDGIATLDPNEVESVTVLKDASATAVFGVRGANGVILITTRRGEVGKTELSISVDHSLQQFTVSMDRIHSWEYAELRNQAFTNDGKDAPYNAYMIDMYKSGEDPVFFPDRDIMSEFFKKWAPQTRVNVNMNGGTEKINYFINVGYIGQSGQFKTESPKALGYDPSYKMNRYNFRSNVDYKLASNLKLSLNLASYLQQSNTPQCQDLYNGNLNSMIADMVAHAWATPPTTPGPVTMPGYTTDTGAEIPANQIVGSNFNTDIKNNKWGELNRRGYQEVTNMNLNSSLAIDWGLDFITKGLSTKFMVAFDAASSTTLTARRVFDVYRAYPAQSPDEKSYYQAIEVDKQDVLGAPTRSNASNYYLNLQYSINYARQFEKHDVSAMALFQRDNWQKANADLPYNMLGLSARATYAYDSRYLAEVNVGYNGSEQFAKGQRFGFFPAFSAGWVASNEAFLRDNPVLTHLKLRASYGKVGNDKLGNDRFLYLDNISVTGGQISSLGRGQSISIGKFGNRNITWEVAYKQNYGIDLKLFHDFSLSVDYFKEKREDILISRGTVPEVLGISTADLPKVNMGVVDNQGFEIEAGYQKRLDSGISFSFKGNFAYNENKQRNMDEAIYSEDYAYRYRKTGYSIGQLFGYKIDYSNGNGFINTPEELEKAKKMYKIGTPRLGDFLYQDLNGDGEISEKDMAPIKYSNVPRISYGFSGSVDWKGLDFSFHFSGIAKCSRLYNSWRATEFASEGVYSNWHKHAWTQERYANGERIEYPALAASTGVSHVANDFFIMDRNFLRLKNVELGYSLPKHWLQKVSLSKVRVYINGNNLLTWKKIKVNAIDPEQSWEVNYPLTKMVNFGLNVVF
ncbi:MULTISPECIES: SusC/RagA family TonB-linked outer membrane protein [Bacteroidaceae]|nr:MULTISPECIES: TonB-dependent receptor [Bacteroidaceae]